VLVGNEDSTVRRVVARCRTGFSDADLDADLRQLLAQVVPYDVICWGLLDPSTLWPVTNVSTLANGAASVRAWDYELAVPDVTKITELAHSAGHVGVLSQATGGDPRRSARYAAVLQPLGVSDELRMVMTAGGLSWGWLALFRMAGTFDSREAQRMATIGPHIARAWQQSLLSTRSAAETAGEPPAVVVLDAYDRIESMTEISRELLEQLPTGRTAPIADILHALAASVRREADPSRTCAGPGTKLKPTQVMVPRRNGCWLRLQAAALIGPGNKVAITLEPAAHFQIGMLRLRAHGLTDREIEVALGAIRNETNPQIAVDLHLSPWTVQDHLKSIFNKTSARNRRELSSRFFQPPKQRRTAIGPGDPLP
jgi:DNA-binding CsgD family transcriptional regulator